MISFQYTGDVKSVRNVHESEEGHDSPGWLTKGISIELDSFLTTLHFIYISSVDFL